MSDLEKFIQLYGSLGITLNPVQDGDEINVLIVADVAYWKGEGASYHPSFEGYSGCCSKIVFDKDGKYLRQGFWE